MKRTAFASFVQLALGVALISAPALAVQQPQPTSLSVLEHRHADLYIGTGLSLAADLPEATASAASTDLAAMGLAGTVAFVDPRTGRWATLLPAAPMIPGKGNSLSWGEAGFASQPTSDDLRAAAWSRFSAWVENHRTALRLDPEELGTAKVTVNSGGRLVQIWVPRQVAGLPVRGSVMSAVINNGNLSLFGTEKWGDVDVAALPDISLEQAVAVLSRHVTPFQPLEATRKARLEFVPLARGEDYRQVPVGFGLEYRLAWVLSPRFADSRADWEALVDAHSGELLAFENKTNYASTRQVIGGVYPLANDNLNPNGFPQSDGVLQTYPLPFADLTVGATTYATDSGGNLQACVDGTVVSNLSGPYIDMLDNCGAINESTAGAVLDFAGTAGTTPHDCTVPATHSAGDTASTRSAFYEINKIAEMGRGHTPDNPWLHSPLPVEVNIVDTCNASGGPGGLNFFRSGGGCTNTGEIAGVFDHEWGHGMDGADAAPGISNPGEGIADIYASLRLNTSCVGRGFFQGGGCNGYGDPCIDPPGAELLCDGVRDINYANRTSGNPHGIPFIDGACGGGPAPCGGGVHCEGTVYSEAVWDLWHRDLPVAPFNMSTDTAREVASRLTFLGGQLVTSWYTCQNGAGCTTPNGCGCGATNGYMNYIAADDDNGNLADGTPHMQAINAAFARHTIACSVPAVVNSGCAGGPTTAPTVSTLAIDRGAVVSWGAVAGATSYRVYRTEGVAGCAFGKTLAGETDALSFVDNAGLQNGRTYNYMVTAMGNGDACYGPASACSAVVPAAGANMAFTVAPALSVVSGDADGVLDNCEAGRVSFSVANIGTGSLTNVRIVSASSPSHPAIDASIDFAANFAPSIAACGGATGWFDFVATGLAFNDTVEFVLEITSDETSPLTKSGQVSTDFAESDFLATPTLTYTFEVDTNGWQVETGTFNRSGLGGGNGTTFSERSSAVLGDQCDKIRSPLVKVNSNSTLSLYNNYDIEPFSAGTWYDRANVALERTDGNRTVVNPTSGRAYNAVPGGPGSYTGCNDGEMGWAGTQNTWNTSTWSAAAFGGAVPAGTLAQLEVTYSTDALAHFAGFWFDQVTLTNIGVQIADAQSNTCTGNLIFADGFGSGNSVVWSATVTAP